MPIRFSCPSCQRVLRVDDQFAGKRSKCPGCSNPLTVPAGDNGFNITTQPSASAPANQWDSLGAGGGDDAGGGPLPAGWLGVRSGLKLVRLAVTIMLCAFGLYVVGAIGISVTSAALFTAAINLMAKPTATPAPVPGPGELPGDPAPPGGAADPAAVFGAMGMGMFAVLGCFILMLVGLVLTAWILQLVGYIKWLSIPRSAGGYGLAMTTLLCHLFPIAAFMLACGAGLALPPRAAGMTSNLISLMHLAAALAGFICFLLFIRQVGVALDDEATRRSVVSYVIWFFATLGTYLLMICTAFGVVFAMAAAGSQSGGAPRISESIPQASRGS